MRVFISWSGETSHKVADTLYEWLQMIKIPSLEPYISDEIEKGALWFAELVAELKSADCGILCLTADNVAAPWLLFEAGALLVAKERSFVSPFLFRVSRSNVTGPLAQFQHTAFTRDDIKRLTGKLNRHCGENGLSRDEFERMFERMYPVLEERLQAIPEHQEESSEAPLIDETQLKAFMDMQAQWYHTMILRTEGDGKHEELSRRTDK